MCLEGGSFGSGVRGEMTYLREKEFARGTGGRGNCTN